MLTVVSLGEPSLTPTGRLDPNPSFTLSPSSSAVSAVAAKSKVLDVSPASKVTLVGTPE